jgi:23S rRNA pseudouridine2605 synthase
VTEAGVRLQRFLARCGLGSRRSAEALITSGRVRVNGRTVTELGTRVLPDEDRVEVDGAQVVPEDELWIALHKQRGSVTTRDDPRGRRTVYDALPERFSSLFHVGRLDRQSEGLLLLTNDGATAHRLTHPSYGVRRVYNVRTERVLSDDEFERLCDGVVLEDGLARPLAVARLAADRGSGGRVRIALAEGRNREVRRMLESLGHRAVRLRRVRYGPIGHEGHKPGAWLRLSAGGVDALRAATSRPARPGRGRRRSRRRPGHA